MLEGRLTLILDPKVTIEAVCKALYDSEERQEWDKGILKQHKIEETGHPNVNLRYT